MDEFRRLIIKQGNGVPTIPVSSDHRNGDWLATDIYVGELYLDLDSGVIYSRDMDGITINGTPSHKMLKLIVSQYGTSAPSTDLEIMNTVGTYSITRVGTGHYRITSTGNFGTHCFFNQVVVEGALGSCFIKRVNANQVDFETFNFSGANADSLLSKASILIEVYG